MNKITQPTVSVIIPTHNRADLVVRAVTSVLTQTFHNLECIVVDDASTDNTQAVLQDLRKSDDRVRTMRHEHNRYASAARNTGIGASCGQFIAFLDDDDYWAADKLEKQISLIQTLPDDVGLVYCWMDYLDADGCIVQEHHPEYRGNVFHLVLDRQRIGGCPTLLVRRNVVEAVGGFDESLPRGNDGDFIRRVTRSFKVDLIPEVLVFVDIGHGTKRISDQDEVGLLNAIRGEEVKLRKFKAELASYPKQLSTIHAKIGQHAWRLRQYRKSAGCFLRAMLAYPINSNVYKLFIGAMVLPKAKVRQE